MFILRYRFAESEYSAVIEDDGRVAYGYLLLDGKILGDVWLYNRVDAPAENQWRRPARMPFLNSRDYIDLASHVRFDDQTAIRMQWIEESEDGPHATIYYHSEIVAKIYVHSKPGRCRAAAKDGPLARVLSN